MKRLFIAIAAPVLLAGCSAAAPAKPEPLPDAPLARSQPIDHVRARLAAAAENISRHANDVAALATARFQKDFGNGEVGVETRFTPNLETLISLGDSWNGPIEPLVKELAATAQYEFLSVGTPPAGGIYVTVDTDYRRIIDMLADAGYQAGHRAMVEILARDKKVVLKYPTAARPLSHYAN